jgi:hypothetical protein
MVMGWLFSGRSVRNGIAASAGQGVNVHWLRNRLKPRFPYRGSSGIAASAGQGVNVHWLRNRLKPRFRDSGYSGLS